VVATLPTFLAELVSASRDAEEAVRESRNNDRKKEDVITPPELPPAEQKLIGDGSVGSNDADPAQIRMDQQTGHFYVNGDAYKLSNAEFRAAEVLYQHLPSRQTIRREVLIQGTSYESPHQVFRSKDGKRFYSSFVKSDRHGNFSLNLRRIPS